MRGGCAVLELVCPSSRLGLILWLQDHTQRSWRSSTIIRMGVPGRGPVRIMPTRVEGGIDNALVLDVGLGYW